MEKLIVYAPIVISLLALLISLLTFLYSRLDKRAKLLVKIWSEEISQVVEPDDEWGGGPPEKGFVIDIVNPKEKRVKILSIWLDVNKSRMPFPDLNQRPIVEKLPFELSPFDNITFGAPMDELIDWLQYKKNKSGKLSIKVSARDSIGNWYKSNSMKLMIPTSKTTKERDEDDWENNWGEDD